MIVDTGKKALLDLQATGLSVYKWRLFTNNFTIAAGTTVGSLTEAAWTGYNPAVVGTVNAATTSGGVATSTPATNPTFSNTSGSSQTFFGWFLTDATGATLIAAVNLGSQTIANGGTFPLAPSFTDNQA
jgi:hypothetical protein